MSGKHRPFDIVLDSRGTWIVSRTGHYRRWSQAMAPGLARLRQRAQRDNRIMSL